MTPEPPPNSENPALPPRHRPVLGDLAKDTTEVDLWDLEGDLSLPDDQTLPSSTPDRPGSRDLPSTKETTSKRKTTAAKPQPHAPPAQTADRIQLNVRKGRQSKPSPGPDTPRIKADFGIDELEDWQTLTQTTEPEPEDLHPPTTPGTPAEEPHSTPAPEANAVADADAPPPASSPPPETDATTVSPPEDEFSPPIPADAKPVSLRPKLSLTKAERWSLIGLAATLLAIAAVTYSLTILLLPNSSERAQTTDFPIQGRHLTVNAATTYWRMPKAEGPNADTFRRGTELLPVLELSLSGGPAAIRVLFRNEDRSVIGDAVTKSISATGTVAIPATAGFDDIGMHAAYRTGRSKPWTIEVFEAPSAASAGGDFKRLFELNISADRR